MDVCSHRNVVLITPLTFDHTVKILFTPKCRLDHTRAPKPISQRGLQARWARANPLLQPLPTAAVRGSRRLMVMWGWGEKTSRASRSLGHICFDMCVRECARVVCICAVYCVCVCICVCMYVCLCVCVCVRALVTHTHAAMRGRPSPNPRHPSWL